MKKIIILCIAVLTSIVMTSCTAQESSQKGAATTQQDTQAQSATVDSTTDLQLKTLDGESTSLKKLYQDKPVYLNFWASWCPPCVKEIPHIQNLQKQYGDKINFVAVTVDENPNDAKAFVKKTGITMPIYTGDIDTIAKTYDVSAIPVSIIIGKGGKIIAKNVGGMDEQALKTFLSPILK